MGFHWHCITTKDTMQKVNQDEMSLSGYERTLFLKEDDGSAHIICEIFSS
jgi:hypothetical protein